MKKTHRSSRLPGLLVAGATCTGLGLIWPAVSFAQQAAPTEPVPVVAEKKYVGPNRALLGGGLITLGAAYIPAVIVAAESNTPIDNQLNIPVVGPWLDLAQRPPCGGPGQFSCSAEGGYVALLIIDGIFQGAGAAATVASFFVPQYETVVRSAKAGDKPHVVVAPTRVGSDGYGVAALGRF
jgi:hypothetical protein